MTKLTYEDKKKITRLYFEESIGCIELARRFNISKKVTQMLIEKYKVHGEQILIKQNNRKLFDTYYIYVSEHVIQND